MSSRTLAAGSSADLQSAVSQNFILQADRTSRPGRLVRTPFRFRSSTVQTPIPRDIRNPKLENNLTADYRISQMSSRTFAAESNADLQSAVSRCIAGLHPAGRRKGPAQPNRPEPGKSETRNSKKFENRGPDSEKSLTADYVDFTDVFADGRS